MTVRVEVNTMQCPDCGAQMNHHADKVDYNAALDDPELVDTDFGGVLEEAHTCPACGRDAVQSAATVTGVMG